jgi:YggT family protein
VILVYRLLDFYSLIVIASVVLSWIPAAQGHPIARVVEAVTEPALKRIRAVVPPLAGFDLSPLVLLFAVRLIQRLLLF